MPFSEVGPSFDIFLSSLLSTIQHIHRNAMFIHPDLYIDSHYFHHESNVDKIMKQLQLR